MSITAAQLIANVSVTGAKAAEGELLGMGAAVEGAGGRLKLLGVAAAAAGVVIGAMVAAVAVASVKMAGDFQQNITKLYTTAGELHNNLQMVGDGILSMSGKVGTGALKLSEAMYWIESGGLHGARGLSALRIAAEAAKAENANLDKVSVALAASLNAYAGAGMTDVQVMNTLTAATGQGMMTFEGLAGSLASVLPAAAKFHVSLNNVTAAMATMTAQGDPAAQAATHLKQVILALEAPSKIGAKALASVGLTSQEVATEMQKSLPDALKMITDAVGKTFPEGSAAYNQAIKNIAGGSKQMMGFLELTGQHMGTFAENVKKISAAVKQGGNDLMGWSDIQQNFNFQLDAANAAVEALMIKIGLSLLPVLTQLFQSITPTISAFTDWISKSNILSNAAKTLSGWIGYVGDAFQQVFTRGNDMIDAFDRANSVVGGMKDSFYQVLGPTNQLTYAFDEWQNVTVGVTQKTKPLIDTFDRASRIIGETTKVTKPMTDSFDRATAVIGKMNKEVKDAPNVWLPFWQFIKNIRDGIMSIDWGAIGAGFERIRVAISKMDWGKVGAFFSNIVSTISKFDWGKFASSFEGWVLSLTKVDWGKVEAGVSKIAGALIGVDWNKMANDLPKIIDGLSKVDWGGIGQAFNDTIKDVKTLVQIFQWGYKILLGGSIIPDIVNGIIKWFSSLPGKLGGIVTNVANDVVKGFQTLGTNALKAVNTFIGNVGASFNGLIKGAFGWGKDFVNNVVSGIQSVSGNINATLHGMHIPGFASGVENFSGGLAYVHAGEVITYLPPGSSVTPANKVSQMMSSPSKQPVQINVNIAGHRMAQVLLPELVQAIRYGVGGVL